MRFFSSLFCRDAPDGMYDVCDEHGHDYRDDGPSHLEAKFYKYHHIGRPNIDYSVFPGHHVGEIRLVRIVERPCRDCPKVATTDQRIDRLIVFATDDGYETIPEAEYDVLWEQAKENEDDDEEEDDTPLSES